MKKTALLGLFCAAISISVVAHAEKALIINQQNSPLNIDSYSVWYTDGGTRYSTEGINHEVSLTNITQQAVTAYKVSFISFDAFNEEMGRALGGVSIETIVGGMSGGGRWKHSPYAAFTFKDYGTGVAYVSKARLADGSIWTADFDFVLARLQEIQADLTADIFESDE